MSTLTKEQQEACRIVENLCRSCGRDCTVIFGDTLVSVAPPAWAGDSTGPTFAEALEEALQQEL